jgi:hypothetical protein
VASTVATAAASARCHRCGRPTETSRPCRLCPLTRPPHRHRHPSLRLSPRQRRRLSLPLFFVGVADGAAGMLAPLYPDESPRCIWPPLQPPQLLRPPPRDAAPRRRTFHAGSVRELEANFGLHHVCPDRSAWRRDPSLRLRPSCARTSCAFSSIRSTRAGAILSFAFLHANGSSRHGSRPGSIVR